MSAPFDLKAIFPANALFAPSLRALAAHAATYAGCTPDVAGAFAHDVDAAFRAGLATVAGGTDIPVTFQQAAGELAVVLTCGTPVRITRTVPVD